MIADFDGFDQFVENWRTVVTAVLVNETDLKIVGLVRNGERPTANRVFGSRVRSDCELGDLVNTFAAPEIDRGRFLQKGVS